MASVPFSQEVQPHHVLIMSLVATQPHNRLIVDLTPPSSGHATGSGTGRLQLIHMVK